jgi:hypothetical protein
LPIPAALRKRMSGGFRENRRLIPGDQRR